VGHGSASGNGGWGTDGWVKPGERCVSYRIGDRNGNQLTAAPAQPRPGSA
jgi:hypothetical protein